jgi:hypothetical protein
MSNKEALYIAKESLKSIHDFSVDNNSIKAAYDALRLIEQAENQVTKTEMVEQKAWQEFREIGLLWYANTFLHMFGWSLVYDTATHDVYPARVKFRGFGNKETTQGYIKVSEYMKNNADQLLIESKE